LFYFSGIFTPHHGKSGLPISQTNGFNPPKMPSSYCEAITRMEKGNVHVHYHDKEYGFPIEDDNQLFARLMLEINQAGLSWTTILNKRIISSGPSTTSTLQKVAGYGQRQTTGSCRMPASSATG